jgi:hypothetical protein
MRPGRQRHKATPVRLCNLINWALRTSTVHFSCQAAQPGTNHLTVTFDAASLYMSTEARRKTLQG